MRRGDVVERGRQRQVLLAGQTAVGRDELRHVADAHGALVAGSRDDVEARHLARVPDVGGSSVVSILIVVDLPAPFGPSRPKIVPRVDDEIEMVDGDEGVEAAGQAGRRDRRPRERIGHARC